MRGYQYLLLVLLLGLLAAALWQFYVNTTRSAPPVTAAALWQAVSEMDEETAAEILDAFPEYIRGTDEHGRTLLHHAARQGRDDRDAGETIQMLIDHDADVDAMDKKGQSPLHVAAKLGLPNVASLLLEAGANAHVEDQDGHTPLVVAEQFRIDQFNDIGERDRLKDRRHAVATAIRQHHAKQRLEDERE